MKKISAKLCDEFVEKFTEQIVNLGLYEASIDWALEKIESIKGVDLLTIGKDNNEHQFLFSNKKGLGKGMAVYKRVIRLRGMPRFLN